METAQMGKAKLIIVDTEHRTPSKETQEENGCAEYQDQEGQHSQ